jgi:hypothetical protein
LRVSGKVAPETAKPLPIIETAFTVSATLPDEVSVSDCVVDVLSWTLPKLRAAELMVRPDVDGFSWRVVPADTLLAVAVMVALCAVVTAEVVAVKAAVVAPLATVTDAGTVRALLLLLRLTVRPLLFAGEVSVTLQASVVAPVSELLLQEITLGAAVVWPVPLRLTVAAPPVYSLPVMVSVPAAVPAVVGSKVTAMVAV